nr:MAG TPA: hypothetical protein [Bacteriophage sp.]
MLLLGLSGDYTHMLYIIYSLLEKFINGVKE